MLHLTIAALFLLTGKVYSGYIYPSSNIPFKLPEIEPMFREEAKPNSLQGFLPKQEIESVVSYSVPFQNLNYQLNSNLLNHNVYLSKENDDKAGSHVLNEHNSLEVNTLQHSNIIASNLPSVDTFATIKHHDNLELNAVQSADILSANIPTSVQLQSSHQFATHQQGDNNYRNTPITLQDVVSPKITKHLYFHVPPPDIEDTPVLTVTPKVKNYKIIFIKVPSQKSQKSNDISQLQSNTVNQVAPIEEKTIIYVISKKPTPQQVYVPKPAPFQHEVFFVNYNGDTDTAVAQISDNLEQINP